MPATRSSGCGGRCSNGYPSDDTGDSVLASERQRAARLQEEIDAAWWHIEHGFKIESRAELEAQAKVNGFKFGLAQAIHHIWKREPKVARLQAALETAQQQVALLRMHVSGHGIDELAAGLAAAFAAEPPAPPEETQEPK